MLRDGLTVTQGPNKLLVLSAVVTLSCKLADFRWMADLITNCIPSVGIDLLLSVWLPRLLNKKNSLHYFKHYAEVIAVFIVWAYGVRDCHMPRTVTGTGIFYSHIRTTV